MRIGRQPLPRLVSCALLALLLVPGAARAGTLTFHASGTGDGTRWDDSYGWLDHSYVTDETVLNTQRQYWQPGWGAQSIYFEIPISSLAGQTITKATLYLESLGFGTGYWYGSSTLQHLLGTSTGNLAVDQPHTFGGGSGWTLFSTDLPGSEVPGLRQFDVTSDVLADLQAGYLFSTFVIGASRDTGGSIYASEYGDGTHGPRLVIEGDSPVAAPTAEAPEPTTIILVGAGLAGLISRRRRTC